jgi:hypothetical protein
MGSGEPTDRINRCLVGSVALMANSPIEPEGNADNLRVSSVIFRRAIGKSSRSGPPPNEPQDALFDHMALMISSKASG